MLSYYLRGEKSSALVRIPELNITAEQKAALAREEAIEQGCLPKGTLLVYCVIHQDEFFYNKLITQEEAEVLKNDKRIK